MAVQVNLSQEAKFYDNLLGMVNEEVKKHLKKIESLHIRTPVSSQMADLAESFIRAYSNNKRVVIEKFIEKSYPFWNKIHVKDIQFFYQNADSILGGFATEKASMFRSILDAKDPKTGKKVLTTNDMDILWKYFHSFVVISIGYLERNSALVKVYPLTPEIKSIWKKK